MSLNMYLPNTVHFCHGTTIKAPCFALSISFIVHFRFPKQKCLPNFDLDMIEDLELLSLS